MADVSKGRFDKRRGPVEAWINFDARLREDRPHLVERGFEHAGNFQRVRPVLTRHGEEHTGPALHEAVAELGLSRLDDPRDILEANDGTVGRVDQRHFAEHFRRKRLSLGLN